MAFDDLLKRTPPHSAEAEESCVGSMLMSKGAVSTIQDMLKDEDFFDEKNRLIYRVINDLSEKNQPVDTVSVTNRLESSGILAKAGGNAYIAKLIENVPSLSNVQAHAQIVLEKSMLRELINAARTIIDNVYEDQTDVEKLSDEAERLIFNVTDRKLRSNYLLIKDIITDTLKGIERISKSKHLYTGLPTGFTELDDKTSGFQNGDLIVIAARPSMGKTAFALNIAANITKMNSDNAVMVFSLEMSYQELALRMLSSESRIDMQRLRKGQLRTSSIKEENEWDKMVEAAGSLSRMKILIDDTPGISLNEIRAKARRVKSRFGIKALFIDHLQLITTVDSNKMIVNRNNEISYISRSLKALAKELQIPIIVLSQLSRKVDERGGDHRPILSDLRESGAIEQDADVVAFLYREEYYNKNTDKKNTAELLLQKQRNGPTGDIQIAFNKESVRFDNLDKFSSYLESAPEEEEV
ncbi:MAG: replicative DNA helicase [Brevinematales bacterium]|jgi:replicative DNA helicase